MQMTIATNSGTFSRAAWTGGDSPTPEFQHTWTGKQLIAFFLDEQVAECGGMQNIRSWLMGDQTVEEKLSIFRNRALMDAWATFRKGEMC